MKKLYDEYTIKGLKLKNRVVLPPMCQFSASDGLMDDYHYMHYTSIARGGVGLIIIEMTNVEKRGRITNNCLGLWDDIQIKPLKKIVDACHSYGAKVCVQIGHAGRKAQDEKEIISSSDIAFSKEYKKPKELTTKEVKEIIIKYKEATKRAIKAGVDAIELHGAHGYLIHQFHSPITNKRKDKYKKLSKFGVEIIKEVKKVMPKQMPLIFRISAIEYVKNGYDINHSIKLLKDYKKAGVDIVHVSSGGEGTLVGSAGIIGSGDGYQVMMAYKIKKALDIDVISVGKLNNPVLANFVIENELSDLVAIGRGHLENPNWTNYAINKIRL